MRKTRNASENLNRIVSEYEKYACALESLKRARDNGTHDPQTGLHVIDAMREVYIGLSSTLHAITGPENWTTRDQPRVYVPKAICHHVSSILDELLAGRIPPEVDACFFGKKRRGLNALQQNAIRVAVRFISATFAATAMSPPLNSLALSELNPIHWIASEYGVDVNTVRRWIKKYPADIRSESVTSQLYEILMRQAQDSAQDYHRHKDLKVRPRR